MGIGTQNCTVGSKELALLWVKYDVNGFSSLPQFCCCTLPCSPQIKPYTLIHPQCWTWIVLVALRACGRGERESTHVCVCVCVRVWLGERVDVCVHACFYLHINHFLLGQGTLSHKEAIKFLHDFARASRTPFSTSKAKKAIAEADTTG